jgi:hypothetical protein
MRCTGGRRGRQSRRLFCCISSSFEVGCKPLLSSPSSTSHCSRTDPRGRRSPSCESGIPARIPFLSGQRPVLQLPEERAWYYRLYILSSSADVQRVDLQHVGGEAISPPPTARRGGGHGSCDGSVPERSSDSACKREVQFGRATHVHARPARGGVRLAGCAVSTSLALA